MFSVIYRKSLKYYKYIDILIATIKKKKRNFNKNKLYTKIKFLVRIIYIQVTGTRITKKRPYNNKILQIAVINYLAIFFLFIVVSLNIKLSYHIADCVIIVRFEVNMFE